MLRVKNANDTLTDAGALIDVGRKASKARGTKESLGDARETLGETILTPGDARETIVTPGDTKEPSTTSTRSSSKTATSIMKSSLRGHSWSTKNTSMEHRSDVLAKDGYLLPEKRTISWAKVAQRGIKQ